MCKLKTILSTVISKWNINCSFEQDYHKKHCSCAGLEERSYGLDTIISQWTPAELFGKESQLWLSISRALSNNKFVVFMIFGEVWSKLF